MKRPTSALATLLMLMPAVTLGDELKDWVHAKIALQREALAPPSSRSEKGLWSERPRHSAATLRGFTPPTSFAPLVRAVQPGVVNISTQNEADVGPGHGSSHSLGSGFIINTDGLVVTNNHVVERAQVIEVRTSDGRELEAHLVGRDPSTDLALLRLVGATNLVPVTLGDSDELEVGDWVVAIGNPFGLEMSVTHGIISARERVIGLGPFDDFIQTNALINPGNSGGPLFDVDGDVVGVTTAIVNQGQGIGFAVPINLVKDLLPNLLENGRLERGWLGVSVQEVVEGTTRVDVVTDVFKSGPADHAGVKARDRITTVQGKPVGRYQQLLRKIALQAPGTALHLGLTRAGKPLEVSATLAVRPSLDALKALESAGRIDALGLVLKPLAAPLAQQLGLDRGLRVEAVVPGSPAELGGMLVGDVIVEVNRQSTGLIDELGPALGLSGAGEPVLLKYRRGLVFRFVALRPR